MSSPACLFPDKTIAGSPSIIHTDVSRVEKGFPSGSPTRRWGPQRRGGDFSLTKKFKDIAARKLVGRDLGLQFTGRANRGNREKHRRRQRSGSPVPAKTTATRNDWVPDFPAMTGFQISKAL
ncbi:unnamed protein product [Calypogeia fissa]